MSDITENLARTAGDISFAQRVLYAGRVGFWICLAGMATFIVAWRATEHRRGHPAPLAATQRSAIRRPFSTAEYLGLWMICGGLFVGVLGEVIGHGEWTRDVAVRLLFVGRIGFWVSLAGMATFAVAWRAMAREESQCHGTDKMLTLGPAETPAPNARAKVILFVSVAFFLASVMLTIVAVTRSVSDPVVTRPADTLSARGPHAEILARRKDSLQRTGDRLDEDDARMQAMLKQLEAKANQLMAQEIAALDTRKRLAAILDELMQLSARLEKAPSRDKSP